MNLIERLRSKENFTSAESSLADYILENIDTVYRMSLQDLAKASYVSKPSVIRLYRKIGCSNYREFSIALQLEKIKTEYDSPIENSSVFLEAASLYEFVEKIGTLSKQIVDNCVKAIDRYSLNSIISCLNKAKRIFVYSFGDLKEQVDTFIGRMSRIGIEPIELNKTDASMIASLNKEDAVLIISISEPADDEGVAAEICDSDAVKIQITTMNNPDSHMKPDYSFYTYPEGSDFIRNNLFVSQMSLLLGLVIIQACLYKVKQDSAAV